MKILAAIITLVSAFFSTVVAQDKEMLTIRQPVDIVTATATAIRAAKHMGRDVESHVITSATYFGDDALPHGPHSLPARKGFTKTRQREGNSTSVLDDQLLPKKDHGG